MQISPSGLFLVHDSIKDPTYKGRINKVSPLYWLCLITIPSSSFLPGKELVSSLNAEGSQLDIQPLCGSSPRVSSAHLSTEFHRPSPHLPSPKGCQFALLPLEKNYTPRNTDYMENKRKQEPGYGLMVNAFTGQQTCFVCGEQGQKGFWKNLTRLG